MTLQHIVILSLVLFCLALLGICLKRSLLVIIMCLHVLLSSVILIFLSLTQYYQTADASAMALVVLTVSSVQVAIGLGLVFVMLKRKFSK